MAKPASTGENPHVRYVSNCLKTATPSTLQSIASVVVNYNTVSNTISNTQSPSTPSSHQPSQTPPLSTPHRPSSLSVSHPFLSLLPSLPKHHQHPQQPTQPATPSKHKRQPWAAHHRNPRPPLHQLPRSNPLAPAITHTAPVPPTMIPRHPTIDETQR